MFQKAAELLRSRQHCPIAGTSCDTRSTAIALKAGRAPQVCGYGNNLRGRANRQPSPKESACMQCTKWAQASFAWGSGGGSFKYLQSMCLMDAVHRLNDGGSKDSGLRYSRVPL